ncbi:predicted protein [Histoplasma capsulatum G186AR]|uniref:Uncharacterized protein n=1 Tax=Ajellomyces capsulatus (strain G186AR / H82 / ATCC MYA-2454 / RMSCC 2432) TaxID=447093 RepID=C0NTK1_AJECG|nr:uncharacterized protein HCBG_06481 [Histoplasma capsulatum G186AR]EEH05362.1 predicted protein [Histoplasma capsulatum G186AR]
MDPTTLRRDLFEALLPIHCQEFPGRDDESLPSRMTTRPILEVFLCVDDSRRNFEIFRLSQLIPGEKQLNRNYYEVSNEESSLADHRLPCPSSLLGSSVCKIRPPSIDSGTSSPTRDTGYLNLILYTISFYFTLKLVIGAADIRLVEILLGQSNDNLQLQLHHTTLQNAPASESSMLRLDQEFRLNAGKMGPRTVAKCAHIGYAMWDIYRNANSACGTPLFDVFTRPYFRQTWIIRELIVLKNSLCDMWRQEGRLECFRGAANHIIQVELHQDHLSYHAQYSVHPTCKLGRVLDIDILIFD